MTARPHRPLADSLPVVPPIAPENGTRLLAGGTDLLTLMKADIVAPSQLIDIKRVEDLPRGIEDRFGAGLVSRSAR